MHSLPTLYLEAKAKCEAMFYVAGSLSGLKAGLCKRESVCGERNMLDRVRTPSFNTVDSACLREPAGQGPRVSCLTWDTSCGRPLSLHMMRVAKSVSDRRRYFSSACTDLRHARNSGSPPVYLGCSD